MSYIVTDESDVSLELRSKDGTAIHNPPILMHGIRITAFASKVKAIKAIKATEAYAKRRGFAWHFEKWKIRQLIIAK